uniref:Glucoamylase n=1 Tax=Agroathelia rolfsii TaxID=39291 RepID=Q12596_9AGAM|nr:glucoamylase G2 [Agroathelia rolfsii]
MFRSLLALAACAVASVSAQSASATAYLTKESAVAKNGVLCNIGSQGCMSEGAYSGIVIASPSKTSPDYLYTWTRDSSLVFKMLIDQYTNGLDTTLRTLIDEFVSAEATIQQTSNSSGTVSTGGLGEPKFNIDETAFTGAWGRPQRDGPALRATAIMTYATYLYNNGNTSYVTNTLWPIIKLDLDYVNSDWNQTTFDLWEEVDSSSFFTTAVQHRALVQGAAFATLIGQTSSASTYSATAPSILCFLQSYWNTNGYWTANTGGGRSGKDANTILASIHTFDASAGCSAATSQPCSDVALANLKVYVDSFRSIYTINSGISSTSGVATGRYPEDSYYNGNPWYLCTLAVAEQLYDALIVWKAAGELNVTSVSLAFFQQFDSSITAGTYASSSSVYTSLISDIQAFADEFVDIVAKYTPSSGFLSEQYDKSTGAQDSAANLTWSYAAAITAYQARNGFTGASWGAKGVSTSCSTGATSPGGSSGSVEVTFDVYATTVYGQNIYITGDVSELGNWTPANGVALSSANYPTWSATIALPADTTIQYKYVNIDGSTVIWEDAISNREITTPASGTYTEKDTWDES